MKKSLTATVAAATALGGVAAGAAWFAPGLAGAQDDSTPAPDAVPAEEVAPNPGEQVRAHLSEALQPLVDDGTLTEAQRDAVIDALEAARPDGVGHRGHRGPGRLFGDGDVAEILGMDRADIVAALRDGQSLADLAEANGVDPQVLVDAIVDDITERVGEAVDAGRLDETRADEILANAEERATAIVEGDVTPHQPGGHRGPGGPGGPGMPDEAPADA